MILDDAHIRRLPATVDPVQRVHLESLIFSCDAISISMNRIREIANRHGKEISKATRIERTDMIINSWAVVDCVHIIRWTLLQLKFTRDPVIEYVDKYDNARRMRNRMDHLPGDAKNVANSKGLPPAYGSLGYVHLDRSDVVLADGVERVKGVTVIVVTSGPLTDNNLIDVPNPAEKTITLQTCQFELSAFGLSLNLDDAERDSINLINDISKSNEKQMNEWAEKISKEENIETSTLLAPNASGFTFSARMEFEIPKSS
ncbi:hypothetical protein [Burkholderia gladioli]|uniref:hypothetical protein n=1 Tax=Burkholderia gladioli TaxID=28095 RepID=UPI0016402E85|nr:hypothetical protein [Burkholderia gladioli]